mmetsp:Transcript_18963/g.26421  ORF Transcript_18963/g.26421 Transcript_18963/m.26421 type:complete len:509 (-) Transcript_18963:205-1731(-)|eukprot:CAMPEP_0184488798 /NCGR_PEP_ID=MMETSP0113_2-20130426/13485_1 /TAXON_ID=91329 /ORGANISM="Norrisiella sphaerica, Strain BC52" /LENGTH=508 /DNA_ID=CAMNT_0026871835 /DNA_START=140 /DNA_END=1666 /DNA_ORIENTATION=-
MEGVLEGVDTTRPTVVKDGELELLYTPEPPTQDPKCQGVMPVKLRVKTRGKIVDEYVVRVISIETQSEKYHQHRAKAKSIINSLRKFDELDSYMGHSLMVSILRDVYKVLPDVGANEELPEIEDLIVLLLQVFATTESGNSESQIHQLVTLYREIHQKRCEKVRAILLKYRQGLPIMNDVTRIPFNTSSIAGTVPHMYWQLSFQHQFYKQVLKDPIVLDYPPSDSYRKEVIGEFIDHIDRLKCEVHEGILKLHAGIFSKESESELSYRSYDFKMPDGFKTVTLKTSSRFSSISAFIWPGALVLADFMLEHPSLFTGKTVLELGSGTGFSSSVLLALKPKRVTVTDYEEKCLKILKLNTAINAKRLKFDEKKVTVASLDWFAYDEEEICVYPPDVVIGSDLVYSPDLIPGLVKVLKTCLLKARVQAVYFVSQRRTKEIQQLFFRALDQNKATMQYEFLPLPITRRFSFCDHSEHGKPKIVKITRVEKRRELKHEKDVNLHPQLDNKRML